MEIYSPTELHLPTELDSPHENHSPTELHSPHENHSPNINNDDYNASIAERGICKTPLRGTSQMVGAIVRGYKSTVTKQLNLIGFNQQLWQRNYYEHIIRNQQSYQKIADYILNNPSKWDNDKFYKK